MRLEFRARYPKTFLIENLIIHFKRQLGHVSVFRIAHSKNTTRYAYPIQTHHSKSRAQSRARKERWGEKWSAFCDIVFESVMMKWLSLCSLTRCLSAWCMGPFCLSNKTHVQKRRIGADNDVVDRISDTSSCHPPKIYTFTKIKRQKKFSRYDSNNSSWNLTLAHHKFHSSLLPRGTFWVACMVREKNLRRESSK